MARKSSNRLHKLETPLDKVLFLLSLPLAIPTFLLLAVGVQKWGRIPGEIWLIDGVAVLFLSYFIAPAAFPYLLISGIAGLAVLFRIGEKLAAVGAVGVLLAGAGVLSLDRMGQSYTSIEGHAGNIRDIHVISSEEIIVADDAGGVILWNIKEHKQLASLQAKMKNIIDIDYTEDLGLMLVSYSGTIEHYPDFPEKSDRPIMLKPSTGETVVGLDDDIAVYRTYQRSVTFEDWTEERVLSEVDIPGRHSIAVYNKQAHVFAAASTKGRLFRSENQRSADELEGHNKQIDALDVHNSGVIVSGDREGKIILWDALGDIKQELVGEGAIRFLAFSRDGSSFVAGRSMPLQVELWKVGSKEPSFVQQITSLPRGSSLSAAAFSQRGSVVVGMGKGLAVFRGLE